MTTAQLIDRTRRESGTSVARLAEQTLIPRTTLQRKLAGDVDFTTTEVRRIALALSVPTASLIAEIADEAPAPSDDDEAVAA